MNNIESKKNYTLEKLKELQKKEWQKTFTVGLLKTLSVLLSFFFLFTLLESVFFFSASVRTGLIIVLTITFIILLFLWFGKSFINSYKKDQTLQLNEVAKEVGKYYPDVKDNLLNSLQLLEDKNPSSKNLIEASFQKVYNQISNYNFTDIIDYSSFRKFTKIFSIITFVFIINFFLLSNFSSATSRLINFSTEFIKPATFSLEAITGNTTIKKGNNVLLHIKGSGKLPNIIDVFTKTKYDSEFNKHSVKLDSNNSYALNINSVKLPFRYFAGSGKIRTKEFSVNVIDPPIINSLSLDIIPPKYSNLPIEHQGDNGNVTALLGTIIKFNISSTKELSKAIIIKSNTTTTSLKVNISNANGSMRIRKNFSYTIHLSDKDSNKNESPIIYFVKTITDKHPTIIVTSPEKSSLLPNNDIVNIAAKVEDDFGFSKLYLLYKIVNPEQTDTNAQFNQNEIVFDAAKLKQEIFYNWNFSKLLVREKYVINFYLEIFDNDNISGPKSTKSEIFKIRIPTLNELFLQAEQTQNEAAKNLEDIFKEAKDLQKDLGELKNELKRNEKKIDWNEKEKVENSTEKFKELNKKIDNVQKNLDKMQKQMEQNDLLSKETMELYDELQKLMDEINNSDLKKTLEQMQKSMQQMDRDKVQKNLEDLAMNEEAFQKSIERTLNLLKKIQIEQKIDEVIKRTEKIEDELNSLQ
ncbi:MAG: hypothetical protein V3V16_12065, partial [Melioribacteraceae bacterium]